jgi:hypothetical protein
MELHYFDTGKADPNDLVLRMCVRKGYVPDSCLLGGQQVFALVGVGEDPCFDCDGPREICRGRPRRR